MSWNGTETLWSNCIVVRLHLQSSKNIDLLHLQRQCFALWHLGRELQELLGRIDMLARLVKQLMDM